MGKVTVSDVRLGILLTVFLFVLSIDNLAIAQEGEPLTEAEIKELYVGNSIKGDGYTIYFPSYGVMKGQEGSYSDEGEWQVIDGLYCARWKNWAQGKELCHELRRDGNKVYRKGVNNNSGDTVVEWYEGNVDGL